jgi:hypothetical protein
MARAKLTADLEDAKANARDEAAQERGPAMVPARPRVAPHYLRGVSPEGVEVVFVPGEALPEWASAKLHGARVGEDGVVTL